MAFIASQCDLAFIRQGNISGNTAICCIFRPPFIRVDDGIVPFGNTDNLTLMSYCVISVRIIGKILVLKTGDGEKGKQDESNKKRSLPVF